MLQCVAISHSTDSSKQDITIYKVGGLQTTNSMSNGLSIAYAGGVTMECFRTLC